MVEKIFGKKYILSLQWKTEGVLDDNRWQEMMKVYID